MEINWVWEFQTQGDDDLIPASEFTARAKFMKTAEV